jgi:hypothetical protein
LLRELSQADLTHLLTIVEGARTPEEQTQAGHLLQEVFAAVAEKSSSHALEQIRQLALVDPARAESLASEPALASIRTSVEQLLTQLTSGAKHNAESRLAEVNRWLESDTAREFPTQGIRPETFVLVATRLIEAGGLVNYQRSTAVSEALIDQARWAPAQYADAVAIEENRANSRIPMRWLFLAWFCLGLMAGGICWWLQANHSDVVAEIWAGGVLVLACFGAWQRMQA